MTIKDFLNKKVGFISLGCDKNRVDLEKMMYAISSAGLRIVNNPADANIIIINTCSFLQSSRLESIESIVEMGSFKNGNLEKLVVTGCLNELGYKDLEESMPEVDAFIRLKDNQNIVKLLASLYNVDYEKPCDNNRIITTMSHYSYLKISDGCNNFCSYCLIPYIRGRYTSYPIESLIKEAQILADKGVKELILVAQDITKYGTDLYGKKQLVPLIHQLSSIKGIERIRLLYCYPEDIDDDLINEIKNNEKVMKYLDIPLQHISDKILKSMNRKSNKSTICNLFDKLKKEIPSIAIRTTFIVGFPGETEEDFNEIIEFLQKYRLHNVGFFKYSREEGTRSYSFENQIDEDVKQERLDRIYKIQYDIQSQLHNNMIGENYSVIIDDVNDECSYGRYYGQAPEIDGEIIIKEKLKVGQTYNIKIIKNLGYDLEGEKL